MKLIGSVLLFGVGCAAGVGACIGLDNLNKNKFKVKKTINDVIDNVTSNMN